MFRFPKIYKYFLHSVPGMAGRVALSGCGMEANHFGWREISSEELKHSTRGIISIPLLVERIENNYRAETHEVW